jgi:beta-galactosidase
MSGPILTVRDGQLYRDNRPHRLIAGSMHYFRIHPGQWEDRLDRLAALGVNAVDTYIPWNFHEMPVAPLEHGAPDRSGRPGFDFDGARDIHRFFALAAARGLDVVARPGPYICAEWDNGGLPARVTGLPGIRVRTSDERFLAEVEAWFDAVVPIIAANQAGRGGNVVAVQIENEYGSFADDASYLRWVADALRQRGLTELLFTADGATPDMLEAGSLPDIPAAQTFGSDARSAHELHQRRAPENPFWCAEFWSGWFDHWGENHHVRAASSAAEGLDDILGLGGSVSIYMAHGGTNFGLWAGANHDGRALQPTVTSYDSDAPIAEDGTLTDKFETMRAVLGRHRGERLPDRPEQPRRVRPCALRVLRHNDLLAVARRQPSVCTPGPATFEELKIAAGLVLYRARPVVVEGPHELTIHGLRDRAIIYVDGRVVGTLEPGDPPLRIAGRSGPIDLDILVESLGRINYGHRLGESKGILGGVQLGRRLVTGWRHHALALDQWGAPDLHRAAGITNPPSETPSASGPRPDGEPVCAAGPPTGSAPRDPFIEAGGIGTATLTVDQPADAFLTFPGFGKGFVWVNGYLLGRYWCRGPQRTLYLPAPVLHAGRNDIVVLELEHFGERIDVVAGPQLGRPEPYIEHL